VASRLHLAEALLTKLPNRARAPQIEPNASCSDQVSVRRIILAYQLVQLDAWLLPLLDRVARYAGALARRKSRDLLNGSCCLLVRLPARIAILRPATIPNDYSSTVTIPKLHFRFPERPVTMEETYADRCREGYRGEPEWAPKFRRDGPSVRRWTFPRRP
jgi:hypothetical protein